VYFRHWDTRATTNPHPERDLWPITPLRAEFGNQTEVANYVATLSADLAVMAGGPASIPSATSSKWSASKPKASPTTPTLDSRAAIAAILRRDQVSAQRDGDPIHARDRAPERGPSAGLDQLW